MTDFKWENPPGVTGGRGSYVEAGEKLIEKPGKWARVRVIEPGDAKTPASQRASSLAYSIRAGAVAGLRGDDTGSFQARAHTDEDGNGVVYARFVPFD